MIESALLKRMNRSKKPFGVETRVGPRNYVGGFLGFLGGWISRRKGALFEGHLKVWEYEARGRYPQPYLVDGSSDAPIRCHYCSDLSCYYAPA